MRLHLCAVTFFCREPKKKIEKFVRYLVNPDYTHYLRYQTVNKVGVSESLFRFYSGKSVYAYRCWCTPEIFDYFIRHIRFQTRREWYFRTNNRSNFYFDVFFVGLFALLIFGDFICIKSIIKFVWFYGPRDKLTAQA